MLEIGKYYLHPDDGVILILEGNFEVEGRVSNFWAWKRLRDGSIEWGYGEDWPEYHMPDPREEQLQAGKEAIMYHYGDVIGEQQAENIAYTVLVAARIRSLA